MTSVLGIVRSTFDWLRQEWRLVVWVWLIQLAAALFVSVFAAALLLATTPVLDELLQEPTGERLSVIAAGVVVWIAGIGFFSMLAITVFRAGLIGTLKERSEKEQKEQKEQTDVIQFWKCIQVHFPIVLRAHTPAWTCSVILVTLTTAAIVGIAQWKGDIEGLFALDIEAIQSLVLMSLPVLGVYWLVQIVISFSAAFGAYEAYTLPTKGRWTAFRKGARFLRHRIRAILALNIVFALVGMVAGYVLDVLSFPINKGLEAVLQTDQAILLSILLFLVSVVAWTAGQAFVATTSEIGNYQLYQERSVSAKRND